MNVDDAINRGNNLVAVAVTALAGFAFMPEIFFEDELVHKLDDTLLFLLGVYAIYWYRKANNRFAKSIVPVSLVGLAFCAKLLGLLIEFHDKADAGDEFGGLVLFLMATIFVYILYRNNKSAATKL